MMIPKTNKLIYFIHCINVYVNWVPKPTRVKTSIRLNIDIGICKFLTNNVLIYIGTQSYSFTDTQELYIFHTKEHTLICNLKKLLKKLIEMLYYFY